jgi:hypothetical protein
MVESIKELRKICYADSKGKRPLYMEWFTMKISIYVTKLILYSPMNADQVSMSMVLLVLLGSIFMGIGTLPWMLAGILIIHFTIVLDSCNGEVARYRKEGSMMGTFMEQYYHEISVPLIFFSFSYGLFILTGMKFVLIFGFLSAIFSRSTVLSPLKSAVVKNTIRDNENKKTEEKLRRYIKMVGKSNLKGGSTKKGQGLYSIYGHIREFWSAPFNIVHLNVIIIFEMLNLSYNWTPSFYASYAYLIVYGSMSFFIQIISFIVHYRGNTIYHYYVAINKKKK